MRQLESITLSPEAPLREAMRVLDQTRIQIILVSDANHKLLGTLTDGDIRRALLREGNLEDPLSSAMNSKPLIAKESDSASDIRSRMRSHGIRQMPIVSDDGELLDLMMLSDPRVDLKHDVPVVLIVGGLGQRLRPLTEECPKPMLEIGGRPILERIINRFKDQGFQNFFLSVNYLGHVIEEYFGSGEKHGINVTYLREQQRMGTGGALSLLGDDVDGPIIVMNGDLITEVDFRILADKHLESGAAATMCTREHRTTVPFGVVEAEGEVYQSTVEKPTLCHRINAGIYCLSPAAYRSVPRDEFYDMPTLFSDLVAAGHTCRVHAIDGLWLDIGTKQEFDRAQHVFAEA